MSNPIIRVHNMETNETMDREMTDEEFANYTTSLLPIELSDEEIAAKEAKESAQLKLSALGLTDDDLRALGLL